MFLPRLRPLMITRRTPFIAAQLHTTLPVVADFASYGKSAIKGTKADVDVKIEKTSTSTYTYTKQQDETPEPRVSHTGTRTYVVAPKDSAPYDVPGGEKKRP